MSAEAKQSVWVKCTSCSHEWVGMYLPMPINDATEVMRKMCCPMCAADARMIQILVLPTEPK